MKTPFTKKYYVAIDHNDGEKYVKSRTPLARRWERNGVTAATAIKHLHSDSIDCCMDVVKDTHPFESADLLAVEVIKSAYEQEIEIYSEGTSMYGYIEISKV